MFFGLPTFAYRRRAGGPRAIGFARFAVAGVSMLFLLSACESLSGSDTPPVVDSVPYEPVEVMVDAPAEPDEQMDPTRETILEFQKLLAAHGYDPGPIDGVVGELTAAAIRRFQADSGMEEDGKISPALHEELKKQHKKMLDDRAPARSDPKVKPLLVGYDNADAAPVYEPGDVFIYSNGRIETVVRVGGNQVVWRREDGSGYTSYPNFMLPWITWHDGSGAGRRSAETDIGDLWPMSPGIERAFQVRTSTEGGGEDTVRKWRCRREGKKRITVAAGAFDTVVFSCDRSKPPHGEWKRRVWYYAPAVRHYVRRDEIFDGKRGTSRVELFAVRPGGREWPPAARAGLGWAVQDTLRNKPTGEKIVWRSTGVGTEFLISATMEPVRRDGKLCRSYILVSGQRETARTYPAVACLEPGSGRWLVPGTIDGSSVGPVVSDKF